MALISQVSFGVLNGIVWGLVLALASSGLNVIFGLLGIVNVAHGSFYMLGAFLGWFLANHIGSYWLALVIVPVLLAILGMGIEVILKPVENDISLSVLSTFGVMLALQGAALLMWGGAPKRLAVPLEYGFSLFGTGYSYYRIIVALVAILVLFVLWLLLDRTGFGLKLRAAREDSELSLAIGIPVPLVYTLGFGLGAGLAGLSGVLVAPMVSITPDMGVRIFALVFLIVIAGGLGRIWNSVLVAISFSALRGLLTVFVDPTKGIIATFVFVLLLLTVKPDFFQLGENQEPRPNGRGL